MERSLYIRIALAAWGCLFFGTVLKISAACALLPEQASVAAVIFAVPGVALLALLALPFAAALVTPAKSTKAYRAFYQAEHPLDGAYILETLRTLARSVGSVRIVWQVKSPHAPHPYHPFHLCPQYRSYRRFRMPAPDQSAVGLSGASSTDQAKVPNEAFSGNSASSEPYRLGKPFEPLDVRLYFTVPARAEQALKGVLTHLLPGLFLEECTPLAIPLPWRSGSHLRAFRWRSAALDGGPGVHDVPGGSVGGSVQDPLSCGVRLADLASYLGAAGESAVREKCSYVSAGGGDVTGEHICPHNGPDGFQVHLTIRPHGYSALLVVQQPGTLFRAPGAPGRSGKTVARNALRKGRDACSAPHYLQPLIWARRALRPSFAYGLFWNFVRNYPLWDRYAPFTPGASAHRLARAPLHDPARSRADGAGVGHARTASSLLALPPNQAAVRGVPFPATSASFLLLSSAGARQVPLPAYYSLPASPGRILTLGCATCDGTQIGLPILAGVSANANVAEASEPVPTGTPLIEAVSTSFEPVASRAQARRDVERACFRLHPLMTERLLVVGGSDAWRRELSALVVGQCTHAGATVISLNSGAPLAGSTTARGRKPAGDLRRAIVDLDSPASSLHPNMLYIPAPAFLPPVRGEAVALMLALEAGLPAHMRFLESVRVTGLEPGLGLAGPVHSGNASVIAEALVTVLLLRHHRARLLCAARGLPTTASAQQPASSGAPGSSLRTPHPSLPPCPDLVSLSHALARPDFLPGLLRRESMSWNSREIGRLLRHRADADGVPALDAAHTALARARRIERMTSQELYLYASGLSGQLKRLLARPGLARILGGPHVSPGDLLDGGAGDLIDVRLGAPGRTAAAGKPGERGSSSVPAQAAPIYGLYLLWSLDASSQERIVLSSIMGYPCAQPALLLLDKAEEWFRTGSPLAEPGRLRRLSSDGSEIGLVASAGGLRDLGAYARSAAGEFGTMVFGPPRFAPLSSNTPDASIDEERALLLAAMRSMVDALAAETAEATDAADVAEAADAAEAEGAAPQHPASNAPGHEREAAPLPDAEALLDVTGRLDEGSALVSLKGTGGRRAICTAYLP